MSRRQSGAADRSSSTIPQRGLIADREANNGWLMVAEHLREMGFSDAVVSEVERGVTSRIMGLALEGDGPTPASTGAIAALPEETLCAASLVRLAEEDDPRVCCICLDDFGAGAVVTRLPCAHLYHAACIKKWLHTSGLCPQCKHRLA